MILSLRRSLSPITESVRPPRYRTHLYWSRKSPDIISKYIPLYSESGDIVLDPFCGSGVFAIEAAKQGRAVIASDIDPVGIFIGQTTVIGKDVKIQSTIEELFSVVSQLLQPYYETKCPICSSNKATIKVSVWVRNLPYPTVIRGHCALCGMFQKTPDENDQNTIEIIDKTPLPPSLPSFLLQYPDGTPFLKSEGHKSIQELYTRRNLLALGLIHEKIINSYNSVVKNCLLFGFSSILHLASKLSPDRKSRPLSSHWGRPSYWIPSKNQERNVLDLVSNAFFGRQGLIRAFQDSQEHLSTIEIVSKIDKLTKSKILFKKCSVTKLNTILNLESVDLILTDPPYGGAIQYYELNTIWASWLGFERDHSHEITINVKQQKDISAFEQSIEVAFKEMHQVLKPEKKLVLTFHTTNLQIWKIMVQGAIAAGFTLEDLYHQPSRRISFKALAQPLNAAIGDYIFIFHKKRRKSELKFNKHISETEFSIFVRDITIATINKIGRPCTFTELLTKIYPKITRSKFLYLDTFKNLQAVLKRWLNQELWLVKATDPISNNVADLWWTAKTV